MHKVTQTELARRLGVHPSAISRAVRAGRITADADGLLDPAGAAAQWAANRQRRPRRSHRGDAAPPGPEALPAGAGSSDARERRDRAEAEIAELRAAEMRGELVRKADIEREFASVLVALRDALDTLGDRLAAVVAAQSDPAACRRLIRDEHRQALAALVERVAPEGLA